jgi:ATP-binding cassette subfamily A (ABC1) protein 3
MYQNQIFALLGQNGAGKSTTISMLTGLIPSSEGKAVCFDKDMFNQAADVRKIMGVCP